MTTSIDHTSLSIRCVSKGLADVDNVAYRCGISEEHAVTPKKPVKKNASIEVRLSDEAKSAFMERCRDQGRTASEAIRLFIDDQMEVLNAPPRLPRRFGRVVIAGFVGTIFGLGVAAPSIARSTADCRIVFQQLDRNHDGVIDHREFDGR
jgi:hypothetical protein